ncbi:MAG: sigma-54 factor interaction domain-containing protein, partial [Desulfobacula sp.]|nr:sigma-54 factor interaction domain-containing protein [Desulfobacula sp.]
MIGVLQISDKIDGQSFIDSDLEILNVFANVCSEAILNEKTLDKATQHNRALIEQIAQQHKIIGKRPRKKKAISDGLKVADTKASVLILGDSGTGKELMARMIHDQSSRKAFPLVVLNCGALTESLLEDELFGHEKGAFTGA